MSVSTHVLDAVAGRPAAGIPVTLERRDPADTWVELAVRVTDADGRVADLVGDELVGGEHAGDEHAGHVGAGTYRLRFDVSAHFGGDTFYPEVVIVFRIKDAAAHHHVPLLLSPYAYSTYRGS